MSTTTDLNPVGDIAEVGAAAAVGVAAGGVALVGAGVAAAAWLLEETADDRAMKAALGAAPAMVRSGPPPLRAPMLAATAAPNSTTRVAQSPLPVTAAAKVTTVRLHARNAAHVIRAAEAMGYTPVPVAAAAQLQSQIPTSAAAPLLLANARGERLAIGLTERGQVFVQTAGPRARAQAVVRQHTTERAVTHLASRGMAVQTAQLPSGELQILAREQPGTRSDGRAEVKAQVRNDGSVFVDVDKIRGNRCDIIIGELAVAVGAPVNPGRKKASYYEEPGEPTRPNVKA